MNRFLKHFLVVSRGLNFNEGGDGAGSGGSDQGSNDQSGGSGKYFESFPEDVRSWDEVKNSETPEAFWQQISSHRQHLGQSIRIPGEDAGKEDWDKFNQKLQDKVPTLIHSPDPSNEESMAALYGKLGRPESADKYSIPEFKDAEGAVIKDLDMTATENFKKIAHANGLTQAQFEKIVTEVTSQNIEAGKAAADKLAENRSEISTEWGAAEDKNYTILKNFAKKTDAPPNIVQALEQKTLDSATVKWMLSAANASFGDNNRASNDEGGGDGVMTPGEAATRQREIMTNKEHPYWNKMDPGHMAAVARVRELIILQNPETATKPAPGTSFNVGG